MKVRRAEISVFFAAVMMLIGALLLGIAESARMQSARLYMTVAMNSAMDSLFSQYHRELWDKYRILGLEHYKDRQLTDEMAEFISPYFEARDMYPMSLKDIRIAEKQLLTDQSGEIFEKEILDYMKYGIAVAAPRENAIGDYMNYAEEAINTDGIADRYYRQHIKEALRIEEIVGEIKQLLEEQKKHHAELVRQAERFDLSGVTAACNSIQACLRKLQATIKSYNEVTIDFYERLVEAEREAELDHTNGKIGKTVYEELIREIGTYKEYFSEDSSRSGEINALKEAAGQNIDYLDALIEQAELAEMEINDYVPEGEGDGPDIAAIWQPVIEECTNYRILHLEVGSGVEDREKKSRLESLLGFKNSRLMKMLLPEGVEISNRKISKVGFPSIGHAEDELLSISPLDRFYIASYVREFVDHYGKGKAYGKTDVKADGNAAEDFLGVEYILKGKDSSYDNLSEVVYEMVAARTGLNLIFLYGNSRKQAEAYALAAQITGAIGFTPVIGIVKNMIITAWAFAQGMCDVRDLLHGGSAPFMHNDTSFYVSADQLFEIPVSGCLPEYREKTEGMKYSEYLGLMLIMKWGSLRCYRTMDMLQMDIAQEQKDFRLSRCASGLRAEFDINARMLFTRLGFLQAMSDSTFEKEYLIKLTATDSY